MCRCDSAQGHRRGFDDSRMRPFIFGGLGATQYSPGDIHGFDIESSTRFSTTWGGGVKIYATDNLGFNFTARPAVQIA